MSDQVLESSKDLEKFGYKQSLSRTLNVWQLSAFGLTYLQPIGPAVIFGFLLTTSGGTVALPYLFAFIGMLFTINSYAILIKEYPLAGSVYHYAKNIMGPFFGFLAGWLFLLDYILIPTITSVCASIYAHQLIPAIPYEAWLISFVLSMGYLNLKGIKATTNISTVLLLMQAAVVLAGFTVWTLYIVNHSAGANSLFSLKPFHFESLGGVVQASSLAIFGFLGFDAVTTLAEESVNPRKDIPRAMLICACVGFAVMFITGYLGVLTIPDWKVLSSNSSWVNASLFHIASVTGGHAFSVLYTLGFILAMVVSNLVGTTAASRLLFGMGRDKVISENIFSSVGSRSKTPYKNLIFIMLLELILGSFINLDNLAELINFGAISGFIILNICVFIIGFKINRNADRLYPAAGNKIKFVIRYIIFPIMALIIMISLFVSMNNITILFGSTWAFAGIIYYWRSLKLNIQIYKKVKLN
jgi:putrescine importer